VRGIDALLLLKWRIQGTALYATTLLSKGCARVACVRLCVCVGCVCMNPTRCVTAVGLHGGGGHAGLMERVQGGRQGG
jgi:hypothetical protein